MYENVFNMGNMSAVVKKMLYEKEKSIEKYEDSFEQQSTSSDSFYDNSKDEETDQVKVTIPYKIAKALDPNMYRNIEFDTWNEFRRGIILIVVDNWMF